MGWGPSVVSPLVGSIPTRSVLGLEFFFLYIFLLSFYVSLLFFLFELNVQHTATVTDIYNIVRGRIKGADSSLFIRKMALRSTDSFCLLVQLHDAICQ